MQSAVYRAFFIFDLSAMRVIISKLKCHEGYPLLVEFGPPYVALCDCHNVGKWSHSESKGRPASTFNTDIFVRSKELQESSLARCHLQ